MVIEAANASLLGLHKEGQSDPDLLPWTPTIHDPSSTTNHESPTCDWDQADDHWQVPQHGVPPFSDGQVPIRTLTPSTSLSHRLDGPIKNSGFLFFLCVCVCVWAHLVSRTE